MIWGISSAGRATALHAVGHRFESDIFHHLLFRGDSVMIKYVFIDMDNTIAENSTCMNIEFYKGLYLNKRPIRIVIDALLSLYGDCSFIILSKTDGGEDGKKEKIKWLHKYFPYTDNIILIDICERKRDFIEGFLLANHVDSSECLLVDDKKSILQDCSVLGISVKYPQQLICDYENANCHSLTSTYRALNKGRGRKVRRKYDL